MLRTEAVVMGLPSANRETPLSVPIADRGYDHQVDSSTVLLAKSALAGIDELVKHDVSFQSMRCSA